MEILRRKVVEREEKTLRIFGSKMHYQCKGGGREGLNLDGQYKKDSSRELKPNQLKGATQYTGKTICSREVLPVGRRRRKREKR